MKRVFDLAVLVLLEVGSAQAAKFQVELSPRIAVNRTTGIMQTNSVTPNGSEVSNQIVPADKATALKLEELSQKARAQGSPLPVTAEGSLLEEKTVRGPHGAFFITVYKVLAYDLLEN